MNGNQSLKRIRWAVFFLYFSQGLVFSSWASRIPDIKAAFAMDDATWGTMLFMIPIGQLCGMFFSGFVIARWGSSLILRIAYPAYMLALIAIGFSTNLHTLILSLILFGVAGNFCNIGVNTQGVNVENMYGKSIMSSFHGAWSLAGFVGSLIGLLMINLKLTTYNHFLIVSVLVIILILINVRYLQPDIKKSRSVENEDEKLKRRKNKPESFLYFLGLVAFCGMIAEGSMFDWSGVYFKDVLQVSSNLVPIGFASFMITMATGRFVADSAIRRWGRLRVVQVCGALIFIGLFISAVLPNIIATTIAFMIIGLGTSSIVPSIYSVAGKHTNISVSLALTIVSSISFFGFLLGPPIIGYISQATNLRYSFGIIALSGICIVLLSSKIKVFRNED
ncbi:MFS transporter [Dysgonomonas sp. 216]|uniref:MFS transporter n=1 Tax=Dysgonomonas sp. 216 TaxID=2302934 RepID=UPI0013D713A6|nr:MFS transporter [Dysgonomonas sp. 216]NDW19537.1 MFS transporter [Dysgonomonas sp. 216]